MTCREVADFLMEYLSKQLPAKQRVRFETHLRQCPDCVAYLKSYENAVKFGKEAFCHPEQGVPNSVPEELVRAILAARKKA
ncbi:MAG TPA: zf-HC2 domain-containing protein [Candidatus Margulisiibacteriota bacterium]|nr:zf-HC2 domain-containing protein [Candidatus Margulisiibacteriota bacterium]